MWTIVVMQDGKPLRCIGTFRTNGEARAWYSRERMYTKGDYSYVIVPLHP